LISATISFSASSVSLAASSSASKASVSNGGIFETASGGRYLGSGEERRMGCVLCVQCMQIVRPWPCCSVHTCTVQADAVQVTYIHTDAGRLDHHRTHMHIKHPTPQNTSPVIQYLRTGSPCFLVGAIRPEQRLDRGTHSGRRSCEPPSSATGPCGGSCRAHPFHSSFFRKSRRTKVVGNCESSLYKT
jgi:hypothetical protein